MTFHENEVQGQKISGTHAVRNWPSRGTFFLSAGLDSTKVVPPTPKKGSLDGAIIFLVWQCEGFLTAPRTLNNFCAGRVKFLTILYY